MALLGTAVAAAVPCSWFAWKSWRDAPAADPLAVEILSAYRPDGKYAKLEIRYPLDETLFPPEIAAPTLRWNDPTPGTDAWVVAVTFPDGKGRLSFHAEQTEFTPPPRQWEIIKRRSLEAEAKVTLLGVNRAKAKHILSAATIRIGTSRDEVGAPIFYREVNLPFIEAVKDPSRIRWRFGEVSSPEQPPVVLENLPVCGNCHSFSRDGKTLAMDVDYGNNKGSYVITPVRKDMLLDSSEMITWNDFRQGQRTLGLLSQISPDGRFVLSTVQDQSVFVPQPELAFSQLFFPIKGILGVYDRREGTFAALPGADNPRLVQSNPTWSPDGKHIVFARTEAYDLQNTAAGDKILLTPEDCKEFLEDGMPFRFDLYRVAFNGGKGGTPEPLEGASHNGASNFFAKFSPDGKWIVFCRAKNYMLLQPDSELFIIPAGGGQARRLRCNTPRMNSWHSFSPNGRWLVFSSKANSPYTQLFLTHLDDQGRSTPPVWLSRFTAADRAANIPEFVNAKASAIRRIHEQFLDDYSYLRAADEFYQEQDVENAVRQYRKALEINPQNVKAHQRLGFLLADCRGMVPQGMAHSREAIRLDPQNARAHYDLGMALFRQRQIGAAIGHLSIALRHMPAEETKVYNRADVLHNLGLAQYLTGNLTEATARLQQATQLAPGNAKARYDLAVALAAQGKIDQPLAQYEKALELDPHVDKSAPLHHFLGINYARAGRFDEALASAEKALSLARAAGASDLARQIQKRIEAYRQALLSPSRKP